MACCTSVVLLTDTFENTSFSGIRLASLAFPLPLVAVLIVVGLVRVVPSAEHSPVPAGSALKKRALALVLSLRILVHLRRS